MYYPSHAFFASKPRLAAVASALIHALGNEFRFSLRGAEQASPAGPLAKDAALAALPSGDSDLASFWVRKEAPRGEHQARLQLWTDGTVSITFWGFDDEFYEGGRDGPDEAQKAEKLLFALELHRALVKEAGAILSVMSNYTDKYAGAPHPETLAERIAGALREERARGLKLVAGHEDFFWQLAIDKKVFVEPLRACRRQLEQTFHAAEEAPGYLILRRNASGPIFF